MIFLPILLLALPLCLGGSGEGSSESEYSPQKAIERHGEHVNTVLKMAKNDKSINDVLKPLSFLSFSDTGFVFKGRRLADNAQVSIKFFNRKSVNEADREYEMYSYLNAINNTEPERYGISTVYYYGRWKGFIVTAYTKLETTLADLHNFGDLYNHDILLLIQQFIKQSKYIHSRGVRHDNIRLENILTRGCESFLIDFKRASKMADDNGESTYLYAPLRYHQEVDRVATDDWESFLYVICHIVGIEFDWFERDLMKETRNDEEAASNLCGELKANRKRIYNIIRHNEHVVLKPIIRAFAKEALSDKLIPGYDRLYRLVTEALEQDYPTAQCFSWAKQTTDRSVIYNISDLVIPNKFSEYDDFNYPEVDADVFKTDDAIQKAIKRHGQNVKMVLNMTQDGESINSVLRPLSLLGSGGTGFVFKGVRLQDNKPVAIKFINKNISKQAEREYEMYSYLSAINNAEVEKYGIPTVYYYGRWKDLIVTAYTELERTLADLNNSGGYYNHDILLLIQQFIKQSKYIHSHGVRHDNINLENILTRGCESFLIDFDLASKMAEDNDGTTDIYAPLNYHKGINRVAKDDWESFLYVICEMAGMTFDWFERDLMEETGNDKGAALNLCGALKSNRKKILEVIDHSGQKILKPIIRAFAGEALSDKLMPNYDGIYALVTDALQQHFPTVKCFSWTKPNKHGSIIHNISDLMIPTEFNEYKVFNYTEVNEQFFE